VQDPRLPTLADAFDRDDLSAEFGRLWGTSEDAAARLRVGARLYTRYTPEVGCVATYALSPGGGGSGPASIGVVEVDPAGTRHRRFADDPSLPGLAIAADGEAMLDRLRDAFDPGTRVLVCAVSPVRYQPGARCVLRYTLRADGVAFSAFGKLFAEDVEHHAAILSALDHSGAERPEMPRIPGPLAVWPDLGLVVQPAVSGDSLTSAAMDRSVPASVRGERMHAAGRGLGAFHTGVTAPGPVRTWEDDLEELAAYRSLFAHLTPDLATPTDDLARRLRELARTLPEPPRTASHGAFRTDQVVVAADGGLAFVDLDGYCWADPARDLANVLSYLEWRAIREEAVAGLVDAATRALLDGYAALAPLPDDRWLRAYRAATMLKIAGRRLRRLAFDEWSALPELVNRAWSVIPRVR
jgi:hypothetical protein